jgi:hypothetical protein
MFPLIAAVVACVATVHAAPIVHLRGSQASIPMLRELKPSAEPAIVPGGLVDEHGCAVDSGYVWCSSSKACVRSQEQPCAPVEEDVHGSGVVSAATSAAPIDGTATTANPKKDQTCFMLTWCDLQQRCMWPWEGACVAPAEPVDTVHGCTWSAGFSWCEAKQKCLRIWEESC